MRRALANLLLVTGALCLGYVLVVQGESRLLALRYADRSSGQAQGSEAATAVVAPEPGEPLGWVRIRRLGVEALVREGIESKILRASVGHIPRTALPGQPGNAGLAGHRDTFFRALDEVRVGDTIEFEGLGGVQRYRVVTLNIVFPHRTEVLAETGETALTLVTCYPFGYIGAAPQRYVVQAVAVG